MNCKLIKVKGEWIEILNSARTTINKKEVNKEPSSWWKKQILLCEHSPIRQLIIKSKWNDLKYWVSVHFVRHWLGIIHWVTSQRPDRPNVTYNRDDAPQSTLIDHEVEANAQAIINISRKRLCRCAMPETKEAWVAFIETFKEKEPELYNVCVPECLYRGFCPEFNCCGYVNSKEYSQKLIEYRTNAK